MATTLPMIMISGAELRNNFKQYFQIVKTGQPIYITIKGKLVAKLESASVLDREIIKNQKNDHEQT